MKTSDNKKAVVVGLFTLIGIIIFIVGVFALGQSSSFGKTMMIKTTFDDVNGLQTGNNVWFGGVNVGTVKSISFTSNSRIDVQFGITEKFTPFIHNDVKAKLSSDGLIGNRIVVLTGGTQALPLIADGDSIGIEKDLSPEDIMITLQKNNLNLLAITGDLKTIGQDIINGKGTIGKLLNNDSLLVNLQSVVATIGETAKNAKLFTSNLENYSAKLQTEGSFSNDLIADTLIFSKLKASASQIEHVSNTLNTIADNVKVASSSLNDTSKPIGAIMHDQQITDTLKVMLNNLNEGSKKLNDDLEAMQHNFLLRRFFKKKAKLEAKNKALK
jgi:phospholipid/cholesterol/gamma-HCH transport system substrate-binding protein